MAKAMGAYAELVSTTEEFAPALDRARKSGRPALLQLRTDTEQISTGLTIDGLRKAAKERQKQQA
jgi:acetolactate synthase-1/2/3 large subunit